MSKILLLILFLIFSSVKQSESTEGKLITEIITQKDLKESGEVSNTNTPSSNSTENRCNYSIDPSYFTCVGKGRYPNFNDPSCETYYLCNLLRNGSFVQTLYKCPITSFFNPPKQVCDTNYLCPCVRTTSNVDATTVTEVPVTQSISTEAETTSEAVTQSKSTHAETTTEVTTEKIAETFSTTYAPPITTTEDTCNYTEDSSHFTCSRKGRYPNWNDPSCETYYLCNLLRNGSFVQTLYKCPKTSFFNPPKEVCDTNYLCPCGKTTSNVVETTVTEEPATQSISTEAKTTSEQVTQSKSTQAETTTEVTTEITTETFNTTYAPAITTIEATCNYTEDSSYFICNRQGRYPNWNDPTCETYYLCNLLRNGSFVQTLYKCPKTSFFNPPKQVCDTNYPCPCGRTTSNVNATTLTEEPVTQSISTEAETTSEQVTQSKSTQAETTTEVTTEITTETFNTTYAPAVTTTEATCNYTEDSSYFTCSRKGRHPNWNDPTCETYYLCNLLRNGSFVQTLYKCPITSFFNPPKQVCDTNYLCPCGRTTSNVDATTVTEKPVTQSISTEVETTSEQVTQSKSTQTETTTEVTTEITTETFNTTYAPAITTTGATCNYTEDSSYFTCSRKGRYPNWNDPTCETYYLCNLLRNGSFVQTLYKCPKTSFFNPPNQVCDTNYPCPCDRTTSNVDATTVTEEPVTQSISTEAETTSEQVTQSKSTQAETTTEVTTEITTETFNTTYAPAITTTEATCNYTEDSSYFTCSRKGRYPNWNDPTCETYYLCNLLRNGSFVQTLYKCPITSFFNPPKQVCDTNFPCPCSRTTSNVDATTLTEEPVTQSISTEAETTSEQVTQSKSTQAETTTEVTTEITTETFNTTYAPAITTTEATCNYTEDSSYFTCSRKGRYPNWNDPTCETYYLCNLLRNGSFVQTLYKCPITSFFNPPKQVCDTNFPCPCSRTTSNVDATTLTEEPVTQSISTEAETTSEQVTQSKSTQAETTTEVTTEITTETFNTTYAPAITTTEATCNYTEDSSYFTCSRKGRYPNWNDPTCETYYLCNLLRNGSSVQTLYKCPKTSFFNPPKQVCDTNYPCPCGRTTSNVNATTLTEEPVTQSISTEAETTSEQVTQSKSTQAETTTEVTTEITTETFNTTYAPAVTTTEATCNYTEDSSYFTCSRKGRYPNWNDPTCETYYLCNLLRNGSFVQTLYKCPITSFFNPPKQVCDTNYLCPCGRTTSNVDATTVTEKPVTQSISTEVDTTSEQVTQSKSTQTETTTEVTTEITTETFNTTYAPAITTTGATCNYTEDSSYFTCSRKGRYPNWNDPTCETYYLCNLLRNGSFVQTLYKCPKTSFFNPPNQVCDTNYPCPCDRTTSNVDATTVTEEPVTQSISTEAETTSEQVTQSKSTQAETTTEVTTEITTETFNTTYAPAITTTEATCNYTEDSSYFTCSRKGRYPNWNDPTCETYYLCNLLRNGSFVQTLYKCPITSLFNPPKQVCDTNFPCPCSRTTSNVDATTLTEEPVTQSISTQAETTSEQVTQSKSTQAETTTEVTTEITTETFNTTYAPAITTTEATCNYTEDSSYFTCSRKGRYPNWNDPTCETYYLCNLLRNGSFVQTLYKCPKTSFFNPPKQVCDTNYPCPCGRTTSNVDATTLTEEPVTQSISTEAETTSEQVTQSKSTQAETTTEVTTEITTETFNTTYAPAITTTEATCNYTEDSSYFTCSRKGRYPNWNDPTCETYYLCNLLRNGSFVQTLYKCPITSFFNPPKQVCDTNFPCPCSRTTSNVDATTLTEEPVTQSISTEAETTSEQVTQSKSTQAETTTEVTTEITTETFNTTYAPAVTITEATCNYTEDSSYFTCSRKGRYPNWNDPTCETYYLCNLLRNGSFVQTLYKCPITSFFNPPKQVCDTKYLCPCGRTTSTVDATTVTEKPVTQSISTEVETTSEQVTQSKSTQTETTTEVTTEITTETFNTTYAPAITTTGATCNYTEDSSYFTCSRKGRYPNWNDPTCETYYLCNLLRNGSFVQTLYKCPKTSFFNPPNQVCDTNYPCPCDRTTSNVDATTVTEEPVTQSISTEAETTSEQVTQSKSTQAETTTEVTTEITTETFNTTYAPAITTTEATCNYTEDSSYFTCSRKGRYPNWNDPTCETYYLCNLLRNGSFVQTLYKCPITSFFNPPKQVCDTNYLCPCGRTTSTVDATTVTEKPVTQSISTEVETTSEQVTQSKSTQTETTTEVTTEITTETFNTTYAPAITTTGATCNYTEDSSYFTCSRKGRYPNWNDPTCETYYLCNLLRNGSFVQTLYKCPKTSFFNPPNQVCDTNYPCPCDRTTSNVDATTVTEEPVTQSISTEAETTSEQVTQSKSTQAETTTEVTTEITTETFNTTYAPAITTTEATCNYTEDSSYFTCSRKGRYPNWNDPTCETYYLCNLLRNGSFVLTLYKCPITSFFNPPKQVCDTNFPCPCSRTTSDVDATTVTEEPVTQSLSTEAETTSEQVTQSESTQAETTTEVTTEITTETFNTTYAPAVTTTEATCNYTEDSSYFTCSRKGRYPNWNDPTCETYYLCNLLRNGSFVQTLYKCPITSFFNPPKQVCDTNYLCPCGRTTSNVDATTVTEKPVTQSISTEAETTSEQVTQSKSTQAETTRVVTTEITTETFNTTYAPAITTTEATCNYTEDSSYFTCSRKGRYPNWNDTTCETYYLCNLLRNGSFVQTLYKCPITSFFNPPKQVCDTNFPCPCSRTTSNVDATTVTEKPVTQSISTEAETTSEQVTQSKSTQAETTTVVTTEITTETFNTTYAPAITTTEATCNYTEDSSYFTCSRKGRYPNWNDPTCETYYLCNLLRNGSFVQTLYKCPITSFFNPPKQVCDTNFTCPCSRTTSNVDATTVTEEPVTQSISTEAEITSEQVTQSKSTQAETTTEVTTEITTETFNTTYAPAVTTTEATCNYTEDSSYFTCSRKGRYPNWNDPTCETYYLCNLLRNGSFVQTLYKCPITSFFNPPKQVCDTNYLCPCGRTTSNVDATTVTEKRVTQSISTEAETTSEQVTQSKSTQAGTTTEVTTEITTETFNTTYAPAITTTKATCNYTEDSSYFTCSRKGRYPNWNDPTCETYYLCNLLRNGSFVQTLYKCPKTSFFNPPNQVCDTNYPCPCGRTTSNVDATTVTEEPVTQSISTEAETTSEQVTQSKSTQAETTTEVTTEITTETFNTTYAPAITTTKATCNYTENSSYFTCSRKGRYPNWNDPTCETYYLCNLLRNGSFVQTLYKCPKTSFFNPPNQVCDTNYPCPCRRTTSNVDATTVTEEPVTQSISTEAETTSEQVTQSKSTQAETTTEVTTEITTETFNTTYAPAITTTGATCNYTEDSSYFTCSRKGRYPNWNDPTCETYYLCNLLRNGSFVQTLYKCPKTSFFNPPNQVCDTNYPCPCRRTTSNVDATTVTEEPVTQSISTEAETTSEQVTQSKSTQAETTTGVTTEITTETFNTTYAPAITTTGATCNYTEDSSYFTCSRKGRYPNWNDPTCETYYLCNLLRNGSFVQTLYKCPITSFFNPPKQVCDTNYPCPCSRTTSNVDATTVSEEPVTQSISTEAETTSEQVTQSKSTSVTQIEIGKFSSTTERNGAFDVITSKTRDGDIDDIIFTCPSDGIFTDPNDINCEYFYICILSYVSLLPIRSKCPESTTFDPLFGVCSPFYICPNSSKPSNDVTEQTSPSSVSDPVHCTAEHSKYICSANETHPNSNDITCRTYYHCILQENGSFIEILHKCPTTFLYNPILQKCDVFYQCPCSKTSSTKGIDDQITESGITEAGKSEFLCTSTGLFKDPLDLHCKKFYVCIQSFLLYISIYATCPLGTFFDPSLRMCSPFYLCPHIPKLTPTELPSTTISSTSPTECEISDMTKNSQSEFVCSSTGIFKDPQDFDCKKYYICKQSLLILTSVHSTCPLGTFFDPLLRFCNPFYACPYVPTSTRTTKKLSSTCITNTPSTEYEIVSDVTEKSKSKFVCSSTGIFEDPQDLSCKNYYVCTKPFLLYISVHSTCPPGTFFDPLLRLCSVFYSCSHVSKLTTTTSEPITYGTNMPPVEYRTSVTEKSKYKCVCSSTGIFEDPHDFECKKYYVCTKSFLLYVSVHSTCPLGTFFDPLLRLCSLFYSCPHVSKSTITTSQTLTSVTNEPTDESRTSVTERSQYEFVCSSTGIFEDPQDFECKKYYVCTKSFLLYNSVHSTCPPGTLFDPLMHLCNPFYSCPHVPMSTITTSEVPSTTKTNKCTSIASVHFTCYFNGKYPNLNDLTCSTYYLCKKLIIGSFLKTLQSCPSASYFNPVTHICDVNYKCNCNTITETSIFRNLVNKTETANEITTSMTTEKTDITFTCLSTGIFEDESDSKCKQFYVCIRYLMSFISIHSTCPTGTFFDPATRTCSQLYSCPHVSKTTSDMNESTSEPDHCKHIHDPKYSNCSTEGNYPNSMDLTCKTYYSCTLLRNGLFNRSIHTCPFMSYFNPDLQVCEYSYTCPCKISTTIQTKRPEFICPSAGLYADSQDSTCRNFYVCMRSSLSYFVIHSTCPEGTFYDPAFRICSLHYSCQYQRNTATDIQNVIEMKKVTRIIDFPTDEHAESTSSHSIYLEEPKSVQSIIGKQSSSFTSEDDYCNQLKDPSYFNCSTQGIYPNFDDLSCRTYYICKVLENGSFNQILYDCPKTSYFNPQSQMCDVNYICPCGITNRNNRLARSIEMKESENKSVTKGIENNSEVNKNVINAEKKFADSSLLDVFMNTCEYSKPFTCNSSGRFPNWNDSTCRTYYLCVPLKTGSFEQIPYKCPTGSFFCPQLRVCYVNYKCPCSMEKRRPTRSISGEKSATRNESTNNTKIMQILEETNSPKNSLLTNILPTSCANSDILKTFTCNKRGRFPNWNDSTCRTYYLCVPLKTGSFVQTRYKCPKGSYFCPLLRVCNVNYKCPCSTDKKRIIRSVDAEKLVSENETTNITKVIHVEEERNVLLNLVQLHSLPSVCAYNKNLKPFTCKGRGRFPNWNDPTCRSYYLCVPLRTGSFVQTIYKCPKGSFFCPLLRVCNVNYKCPCSTDKLRLTRSVDDERFGSENEITNEVRDDHNKKEANIPSNSVQY